MIVQEKKHNVVFGKECAGFKLNILILKTMKIGFIKCG